MSGLLVEEVSSHCHLGMRLQFDGKWGDQVDHMIQKSETRLRILKAYSRRLNRQALLQLYLSYIRPILEYGCEVWCNLTLGQEERLEGVQLAAFRAITGSKVGTSHQDLYNELSLPTLSARRYQCRMLKMSELLKRETQDRLGGHSFPLVSERSVYRTRRVEDLALPRVLTELAKRSFIPRSIEEWNCLDDDTKACNTKQSLKNRLNPKKKPPAYYGFELDRVTAISFTRLRVKNANLSLNLFRRKSGRLACL